MIRSLEDDIPLDKRRNHTIEVIVDRLLVKPGIEKRLEASIETATKLANGLVLIFAWSDGEERLYSQKLACVECGTSVPELEPRSFSFNSPYGACEECAGIGSTWAFDPDKVIVDPAKPLLEGALGPGAGSSRVTHKVQEAAKTLRAKLKHALGEAAAGHARSAARRASSQRSTKSTAMRPADYQEWLTRVHVAGSLPRLRRQAAAAGQPRGARQEHLDRRIHRHADFARADHGALLGVDRPRERRSPGAWSMRSAGAWSFWNRSGLHYLSLDRSASTLSGGEAQRIRLATQIGSKLRGVLYVLDEPSIGLHPRDNDRLLDTLTALRDMGNTVLVVEHDAETIERADYVIDLGPGAGRLGGELVASGTPDAIRANAASLTGRYLAGTLSIPMPAKRRAGNGESIRIRGAQRAQPERHRRRISARAADRGDRRFGQRQIDAGERHSVSRAGAGDLRFARSARRARRNFRASRTSTR